MVEKYAIYYNEYKCGEIHYNKENDELTAYLTNKENNEFPKGLFTVMGLSIIEDKYVREYIKGVIMPKTRENVQEELNYLGLTIYNEWEIYKAIEGKNANDATRIEMLLGDSIE